MSRTSVFCVYEANGVFTNAPVERLSGGILMLNVPGGMLSGFAPPPLAFTRGGEMFAGLSLRGDVGRSSHEVTTTRTRVEAAAKNAGGTHGRRVFRLGWCTTVVVWAGTSGGSPAASSQQAGTRTDST